MNKSSHVRIISLLIYFIFNLGNAFANQTDDLSPVLPAAELPFRIQIETANFELPVGLHSGVFGTYKEFWIFIAGRLNGMHGFGADPFPALFQNRSIYVVNTTNKEVFSRSLDDPSSGLTQQQIDSLSVTSPQGYQENKTLYMTGGYGIDTATATFGTKPVLTAIYLPGIVQWVTEPENRAHSVIKNIRQINNPVFQITGGRMYKLGSRMQLVFGQNFTGVYTPDSNGEYSRQVRQFELHENNGQFYVQVFPARPQNPDPNFRRRDLNVLPVLLNNNNNPEYALVAYSGVFTLDSGIWTVPVVIRPTGDPFMANPALPSTFKQAMNNYASATAGLYSRKAMSMYNLFFGGLSYGYYSNGVFTTDSEIPFINQVTTIKIDKDGQFSQYLMDDTFPTIPSTGSNPGNTLLFGTGAYFIPSNILQYPNRVISLDSIRVPTVIGYIVGGIQSTVPNTSVDSDSSASPHIFKVTVIPLSQA